MAGDKFDCCGKSECERVAGFDQWLLPSGKGSSICPSKLVTRTSVEFIGLYRHYKNGILPVSGGILDQTAYFVSAMEIIEGAVNER